MDRVDLGKCVICGHESYVNKRALKDSFISQEVFHIASCQNCDFTWTIDAPNEDIIGQYYQSENYISLSDRKSNVVEYLYHFARNYMLKKKQSLVEKTTGLKSGNLLDIGAGTGYFLNHMQKAGWKVEGIEKDDHARKSAIDNFHLDVKPSEHLFEKIDRKFNAITLWHVLEHLYDLNGSLAAIYEKLASDGHLFVAVPNRKSWDAQFFKDNWAPYDVPRHLWHFCPKDMEKLAEKHDLELISKSPMYLDAYYASILTLNYKQAGLFTLRGLFIGFRAMLATIGNVNNASSIIYSFRKKNTKA